VGAEHGDGVIWNFMQLFDELGALSLQPLDHVMIMNDLMTHIDGLAVFDQGPLNDIDRSHNPCAETARLGQNHSQAVLLNQFPEMIVSAKLIVSPSPIYGR
jgi:hypothetical protein